RRTAAQQFRQWALTAAAAFCFDTTDEKVFGAVVTKPDQRARAYRRVLARDPEGVHDPGRASCPRGAGVREYRVSAAHVSQRSVRLNFVCRRRRPFGTIRAAEPQSPAG